MQTLARHVEAGETTWGEVFEGDSEYSHLLQDHLARMAEEHADDVRRRSRTTRTSTRSRRHPTSDRTPCAGAPRTSTTDWLRRLRSNRLETPELRQGVRGSRQATDVWSPPCVCGGGFEARRWRSSHLNRRISPVVEEVAQQPSRNPGTAAGRAWVSTGSTEAWSPPCVWGGGFEARRWRSSHLNRRISPVVEEVAQPTVSKTPATAAGRALGLDRLDRGLSAALRLGRGFRGSSLALLAPQPTGPGGGRRPRRPS